MQHYGESLEDYLEAILVLSGQLPVVRSVDVASYLGYSKPSVSHAVKLMVEQQLIELDHSKCIRLSELGKQVAEETYQRHVFFPACWKRLACPATSRRKTPAALSM